MAGVAYAARPLLPGRFSFPRLSFGGGDTRSVTKPGSEGKDFSRTGVRGTVKKVVAGQDAADQSFGEIVVDEIGGQGTFAATRDVIGNTVDGAGNALAYAGGLVKGGVDSTREMASTIQSGLTAMVDQHFGPSGQQQMSPEQVQAQQAAIYVGSWTHDMYEIEAMQVMESYNQLKKPMDEMNDSIISKSAEYESAKAHW